MDSDTKQYLVGRIKNVEGFDNVQFIILYGSVAEGRSTSRSDIDICIGYDGEEKEASRFRFKVLSELFEDRYDVQIFQLLPLYVRKEVLKGEVLYCRDKNEMYEIAYGQIRAFDDFKHRYYDYIGKKTIA